MNEKLQYATMLEIPVNTANITFKPARKRRIKKKHKISSEEVKEMVMEKVNSEAEEPMPEENPLQETENSAENSAEEFSTVSVRSEKKKKKFKISVIGVELVLIAIFTATIFITNAVYSGSAINAFMKSVFGGENLSQTIVKNYDEYAPVMKFGTATDFSVENGYVTYGGSGAVYSPLDGEVLSLSKTENGLYDMEIKITDNFISVFSGLKYAYAKVGDKVYGNIPVGYVQEKELKMCFKSGNGDMITDYTMQDCAVIWAV